jgi:hypothetical protein
MEQREWPNAEHEAPLCGFTGQEGLKSFLEGCVDRESV